MVRPTPDGKWRAWSRSESSPTIASEHDDFRCERRAAINDRRYEVCSPVCVDIDDYHFDAGAPTSMD